MYNNIIYIIYVNTQKQKTNKISPNPLDAGFKNMFTSTYFYKKKKKVDGVLVQKLFKSLYNRNPTVISLQLSSALKKRTPISFHMLILQVVVHCSIN
jgi:hypothetical protein